MYSTHLKLPPLTSLISGSPEEPTPAYTYTSNPHVPVTYSTIPETTNPLVTTASIPHPFTKNSPEINGKHVSILPKAIPAPVVSTAVVPSRGVHPYSPESTTPPTTTTTRYQPYPASSGLSSYEEHAGKILDEKRRRNATASARFRDRRKQREKEALEKCQLLEQRVKELEQENPFAQQMSALQNELHQVRLEKQNSLDKVKMLENEVSTNPMASAYLHLSQRTHPILPSPT
ncbi:hypothetical protein K493DRAFT_314257 [Basidiobolus meristosporus CBS 931.73]|uniref:BZIP domain-containing protein n=1 Tax=Basidiobolus meristosporus CBS 931.73 TaxID=1314790 RepID=A0A1Y1YGG5_9FUNG|nr:hypothetical protein K493DRAFT_314257 [Basidiobolus meristosporus CBS 931.73]|eukprot:ORX97038.1 hypothetical protein K493DRAFT_314257 [Basidiobolus meristosporus CBS 931.73]